MKNETIDKVQIKKRQDKVRELLVKQNIQDPTKRERFLALMKSRYGYTNDKSIDELKRLLRQFYRSNKSLGIRHAQTSSGLPQFD